MDYLNRAQAPLTAPLWQAIDRAAVTAASDLLTARRFLDLEGPYGVGLTAVEIGNDELRVGDSAVGVERGDAALLLSRAIGVPMLHRPFRLSVRRLAAGAIVAPVNLTPVTDAAEAMARQEERLIYYGEPGVQLQGLLTSSDTHHLNSGGWDDLEQALTVVLAAVNHLDGDGFRGPYALVLSPVLYNGLFRRYAGTDMLQVEHLGRLCRLGVFKAPITGGAVVDARVGRLVIGQDLQAGFASQTGTHYNLYLSESIVLLVEEPRAVCTIGTTDQGT